MNVFNTTWQKASEEAYGDSYVSSESSELQQAMNLFMVDDLEALTMEDLKKMRSRLMKTFHPDLNDGKDTVFAQKINAAYDVLEKYLQNR